MGFKKFLAKRAITMFGVLMATLLVTIALVGANMDSIFRVLCRKSVVMMLHSSSQVKIGEKNTQ